MLELKDSYMQERILFNSMTGEAVPVLCDEDPELSGVFDIIKGAGRLIGGIIKPDPVKQAARLGKRLDKRAAKGKDTSKLMQKYLRVSSASTPQTFPNGLPSGGQWGTSAPGAMTLPDFMPGGSTPGYVGGMPVNLPGDDSGNKSGYIFGMHPAIVIGGAGLALYLLTKKK